MFSLLLAIVSSASMALVLKAFREPKGNRFGILLGNYLTCVVIAFLFVPDKAAILSPSPATLFCGILAGCLFVGGLVSMQTSTRLNGAALTAAFSKLGMLVPLILSLAVFGEKPSLLQLLGLVLVLAALFVLHSPQGSAGKVQKNSAFLWLLITLFACGFSDGMAKIYERVGTVGEDTVYFFILFLTATVLCGALCLKEKRQTGKKLRAAELISGIAVGVPNYFSSYLLLKALQSLPAFVTYPVFSTGTIVLVMLLGFLLFKEKPDRRRLGSIGLILAALVLLNLNV